MIRKFLPVLWCAILFLTACKNKGDYYHHAIVIGSEGWALNQTLNFQDSLDNEDPETFHLEIELRHTNMFPYQNLWLYVRTRTSEGTNRLDSINWQLAEPSGRWLGSGWGSLYSLSHRLPDLTIRKTMGHRWFNIEIQHGLKDPILSGVDAVGVHLFTAPAKK